MKIHLTRFSGFTLVENIIALAVVSVLCLSFIGAIIVAGKSAGWNRDAMDASELIESKLESVRSYSWGQIKAMFAQPQDFAVTNGAVYQGKIVVQPLTATAPYEGELLEVTVSVSWHAEQRERTLQTKTYISRYGFSANSL